MSAPENAETRRFALRAALLYALIGGIWILLSDQAVEWLSSDPKWIVMISVAKGLAFVAVTALVLWLLLRRGAAAAGGAPGREARHARLPRLPILALGLAIVTLTVAGLFHTLRHQEARGLAELRAIAELKAHLLEDWLREREQDARFVADTRHLDEAYLRWQALGDEASGERLRHDLRQFIRFTGFNSAQVLDARATRILWDSKKVANEPPDAVPESIKAAATRAWGAGRPIRIGPYRDAGGHLHLDYVIALSAAKSGGVIVLHIDLATDLFPLLQTWPAPSASGEVVWFRRDGDDVLFLNDLRLRADTAARLRLPLVARRALAAQFLRDEVKPGQAMRGVDYRGVPVFGVVAAVPNSDSFVLAKVDEAELYAGARRDAVWVLLAGLFALFALGVGVYLARQRRDLAIAESVHQAQAERLRALKLLASIADNSTDAIFAKDLDSRYLMFNRETERVTGKTAMEAMGRDDTALFPAEQAEMLRANDRRVIAENQVNTYEETVTTPQGERTYLATKGPLRDEQGKVIGLFGISRDITEREHAARALQRERDRNQHYLDTVQTIMVALDGAGRITMINRKGRELLGYAEDELLGRNWFETCLPQPQGMGTVYTVLQQIMAGELEAVEYFENPILCRDGRQCLIAWHNAYFSDEAGKIIGTLSSGEDISERKADEEALRRQAEELKQRNAELERFNRASVGRELDMIELKKQVDALAKELGRAPPHSLSFLDTARPPSEAGPP